MKKRTVLTIIITAVLSVFIFFLVLNLLGLKINFEKNNPITPTHKINADNNLKINNEKITYSNEEKSSISLYENNVESVVNITTKSFRYTWFYEVVPSGGIGSGSIITPEGHILTNYHVIRDVHQNSRNSSIIVTLYNQKKYEASIVGVDPSTDLAVLKIDAGKSLKPIEITTTHEIKVGQRVYAIGNPFGLSGTFTQGIISSLGRSITAQDNTLIEDVIQTDAAINPGNSGGPLLDSKGRMIGVNTSIFTQSKGNIGIGFAVSSDTVVKVVQDILKFGLVKRPKLGIKDYYLISQLSPDIINHLGYPENGVVVVALNKNSPAEDAGIKSASSSVRIRQGWNVYELPVGGDIILEIDGQKIDSYTDIKSIIKYKEFNETVTIKIWRDGNIKTIKVKLSK